MGLSKNKGKRKAQLRAIFAQSNIKRPMKKTFKQLHKSGVRLKPNADIDLDGVKNKKDCRPLDYKKQGRLHDFQVKLLKRKEEKLERLREKELRKLEDRKDILVARQKVASKKADITRIKTMEKQAIIDEINTERSKIRAIKSANQKAKRQLDKLTTTGKAKTLAKKGAKIAIADSKRALRATSDFINKDSTKKTVRDIGKSFRKLLDNFS